EKDAVALLQSHGYRVLQTQVEQLWQVRRGTDTIQVRLRADARVSRNGRQFIAEVKSGSLSANVRHGPTRRQLLEYAVAYRTSGVLLVDMHQRRIDEVVFTHLDSAPRT